MSRGHHAIKLLADMLIAVDNAPPHVKVVAFANADVVKFTNLARTLVREATAAATAKHVAIVDPNYCALCQAMHPQSPEPEPHGARRGP